MRTFFAALVLAVASSAAAVECERPYPVNLPNNPPGGSDAMLELQARVKSYLAEADDYLVCNEGEQARLAGELDGGADSADNVTVQIKILLTRYNNTVDEMHVVGERFNTLVRAYNSKRPDRG